MALSATRALMARCGMTRSGLDLVDARRLTLFVDRQATGTSAIKHLRDRRGLTPPRSTLSSSNCFAARVSPMRPIATIAAAATRGLLSSSFEKIGEEWPLSICGFAICGRSDDVFTEIGVDQQ